MKGMSLPIEIVVIIIVALIVLIGVAAFFTNSMRGGEEEMMNQQSWQNACSALKMRGCTGSVAGLDPEFDDSAIVIDGRSFLELCEAVSGIGDRKVCCEMCCGNDPSCDS